MTESGFLSVINTKQIAYVSSRIAKRYLLKSTQSCNYTFIAILLNTMG